jgi:hypothetical protein
MVRFFFNNGESPPNTMKCTGSDDNIIDDIFSLPIQRNRNLRTSSTSSSKMANTTMDYDKERELWPGYCKDNCAGYATGTCRATGCAGYRRNLQVILPCNEAIASVHDQLDNLILLNAVSDTCKLFLDRSRRKAECFDDIIYGEVESFDLWTRNRMDKKVKVTKNVKEGFTICTLDQINIEAIVNPCVKYINSVLTGPTGFTHSRNESTIPYTVFGDASNIPILRNLQYIETYTFTAIPDNFAYK